MLAHMQAYTRKSIVHKTTEAILLLCVVLATSSPARLVVAAKSETIPRLSWADSQLWRQWDQPED